MVKTAASALILTLEARAIDLDNIVDILLRKENTVNLCFQFYNFFVLGQWWTAPLNNLAKSPTEACDYS